MYHASIDNIAIPLPIEARALMPFLGNQFPLSPRGFAFSKIRGGPGLSYKSWIAAPAYAGQVA
jgi:hypothetical protein